MASIARVLTAPIVGAYFCEDLAALQGRSTPDAERWLRPGVTPGFRRAREIAEGIAIGLGTDSGRVYWGDAVSVSYAGKAGRHGVFRAAQGAGELERVFGGRLVGRGLEHFRAFADEIAALDAHPALHYGLSQALLRAVAGEAHLSPWEILCREWGLPIIAEPVALQGSCGNDRFHGADKMIAHRLDVLPHTQVDDPPRQLGARGEVLLEYVRWLVARCRELAGDAYRPVIHLDVHGAIGRAFGQDVGAIVGYLAELERACADHPLRVESIFLLDSRAEQIRAFAGLRERWRATGGRAWLVADEWANTKNDILEFARARAVDMIHVKMPDLGSLHHSLEAVLECHRLGVATLLGGSCIETDASAALSVHVALAARPTALLAKPGMGICEAIQIVKNEQSRLLVESRAASGG